MEWMEDKMAETVYRMRVESGRLVRQASSDGVEWVTDPTFTTSQTSPETGTGKGAVAHAWYSSASIIAFLLVALPILGAVLHAYQPSPENAVLVKAAIDGIDATTKALQTGQAGIKADVAKVDATVAAKPAAPVIVVPSPTVAAQANPLLNLPPDVAQKYLAEYLKVQQEKQK